MDVWQNRAKRTLALVVATAVLVGAIWWLFRTTAVENDTVGIVRYKRSFGRIVAIEADRDGDGKVELRVSYSWSQPFHRDAVGPGCLDTGRTAEDRNYDGRWDTWYEAVGPNSDGDCVYLYSADLDLDEEPDWEFESVSGTDAFVAVKERRGF